MDILLGVSNAIGAALIVALIIRVWKLEKRVKNLEQQGGEHGV